MAIRPLPCQYHCPACGWSKTVAPRSDALGPGDFYRACPACGHSQLESKPVHSLLEGLAPLLNTANKLWSPRR